MITLASEYQPPRAGHSIRKKQDQLISRVLHKILDSNIFTKLFQTISAS